MLMLTAGLWSSIILSTMTFANPSDATTITQSDRSIANVEPVNVQVPVGCAPRLPYQVWVTYSDGQSEFRQVKWTNSSLAEEQAEADSFLHPIGTAYQVKGYIIGDNTTPAG